jgi:DNA-binding CsgD family transcriptional regulator
VIVLCLFVVRAACYSRWLELYDEGKTTHEIAKEQRLSLRDISHILKNHGANHGIATIDDDDNKKSQANEKFTQAYKLFSEGKTPLEVAIELDLREKQVNKLYRVLEVKAS